MNIDISPVVLIALVTAFWLFVLLAYISGYLIGSTDKTLYFKIPPPKKTPLPFNKKANKNIK